MILLLHNLVPHAHHGEMSAIEHVEEHSLADNPIDWFLLSFHSDLGEEHLECFSEIEHPSFDFTFQPIFLGAGLPSYNPSFDFSCCNTSYKKIVSTAIFEQQDQLKTGLFYLSDAPLRAPPYHA